MDYSQHMLARAEHNRMIKSLPTVPEYGYNLVKDGIRKQRLPILRLRLILTTILHFVMK
jgi:hypothetical protein